MNKCLIFCSNKPTAKQPTFLTLTLQIPGERQLGNTAVYHPEQNEGQQSESLHTERGCTGV